MSTAAPMRSFDVRVRFEPPTERPRYDRCGEDATTIDASGTYTGYFAETGHDHTPSCGSGPFGGDHPDGAYRLSLSQPTDVRLELVTLSSGDLPRPVLSVHRASCDDRAEEIACRRGTGVAVWTRPGLPAGDYFVVVEDHDPATYRWTLFVDLTTPRTERRPGDACGTAPDVTERTETVVVSPDFVEDVRPSCVPHVSPARDAFFRFTVEETSDVTLETTVACAPESGHCGGGHYRAILSRCELFTSEVACATVADAESTTVRLEPGIYWAVVWTQRLDVTSATARVTLRAPSPEPDGTCDGTMREICGDTVFIDRGGTTVDLADDVGGTCATATAAVDAVYRCTLAERRLLGVNATRSAGGPHSARPIAVSIRADGCPGTAVACAEGATRDPATATTTATLDPGTHHVVVETAPGETGPFTLVASTSAPP